ncbi:hypothetical protein BCR43DRAFT_482653 [Syncephalastrum racemosum]|uniref:peptidylprolyl isomerase n=1 Tax=Syncephalastrum racemosum TaxID=13706 RepID=A0A1X2HVC8_SYNRA|nr:hypothetical protein BCR43DRAFT_482653 [Syncephalastrum racemosum]
MRVLHIVFAVLAISVSIAHALKEPPKYLQIGVKKRIPDEECTKRSRDGDVLSMHYTGTLFNSGEKFDSSLDRNQPLEFTLGTGRVIKGWDQGLKNMCIGEKRRLVIPPELGYGDRGAGSAIPGGATLVFDVELVDIKEGTHHYPASGHKNNGPPNSILEALKNLDYQSPVFLGTVGILVALLGLVARAALSSGGTKKAGPPAGTKKAASTSKSKKVKE